MQTTICTYGRFYYIGCLYKQLFVYLIEVTYHIHPQPYFCLWGSLECFHCRIIERIKSEYAKVLFKLHLYSIANICNIWCAFTFICNLLWLSDLFGLDCEQKRTIFKSMCREALSCTKVFSWGFIGCPHDSCIIGRIVRAY